MSQFKAVVVYLSEVDITLPTLFYKIYFNSEKSPNLNVNTYRNNVELVCLFQWKFQMHMIICHTYTPDQLCVCATHAVSFIVIAIIILFIIHKIIVYINWLESNYENDNNSYYKLTNVQQFNHGACWCSCAREGLNLIFLFLLPFDIGNDLIYAYHLFVRIVNEFCISESHICEKTPSKDLKIASNTL